VQREQVAGLLAGNRREQRPEADVAAELVGREAVRAERARARLRIEVGAREPAVHALGGALVAEDPALRDQARRAVLAGEHRAHRIEGLDEAGLRAERRGEREHGEGDRGERQGEPARGPVARDER
jgi:hypothetical protein